MTGIQTELMGLQLTLLGIALLQIVILEDNFFILFVIGVMSIFIGTILTVLGMIRS